MEGGPAGGAGAFFQTDTLGTARVDLDGMATVNEDGSGSGSDDDEDAGGWPGGAPRTHTQPLRASPSWAP